MGHGLVWNHTPVLAHIPAFPCHFRGQGTVSLRAHGLGHATLCSDSGLELLHLSTGLRIKLISSNYSSVLGNLPWLSLVLTDCQKSSCWCWKVVLFWPLTGNRAETLEFEFLSGEIRDISLICYQVTVCSQHFLFCSCESFSICFIHTLQGEKSQLQLAASPDDLNLCPQKAQECKSMSCDLLQKGN